MSLLKKIFYRLVIRNNNASSGVGYEYKYKIFRKLIRYQPTLKYIPSDELFEIKYENRELYISRTERMHYYKKGIASRLDFLKSEYFSDEIVFSSNDILIDIGANIGEFSLCHSRRMDVRVIAIEPEDKEFRALQMNLSNVQCELINKPVWSEKGEHEFFSNNQSGDSSLIRFSDQVEPVLVECTTIDEVLRQSTLVGKNEPIKFLKLEAEGAEPEVLMGMTENLTRVEYVAADVGAERGISKESTLIEVLDLLSKSGFVPIKFGLPRAIILFRNSRFI